MTIEVPSCIIAADALSTPPDPSRDLRRTLRLYRLALLLVGAIALAVLVRIYARRSGAEPELTVIDLNEEIATATRTRAEEADTVRWFLRTPEASIHLHALGPHQTCPLHIHRKSHETTLVVSGAADVTHVYGADAAEQRLTHAHPGMLIDSPPFCGHAWKNAGPDGLQANLVMESPPFDGNLYLDDADRSRANGPPPAVDDVLADLADFARSSEPSRTVPVPNGRLSILFLRSEGEVAADPKGTLAVYTVAGSGTLDGASGARGARAQLAPKVLVLATGETSLRVHASVPTALLLFKL
jgi:Cupin